MKNDKATYPFEVAIKKHLDEVAKKDATFRQNYEKPNKSIKECCNYIIGKAREQQKKGVATFSDEETYGMAIHYYDEDDIKVDVKDADVKVAHAATQEDAENKVKKSKKPVRKANIKVEKTAPKAVEAVTADTEADDDYSLDIPLF